MEKIVNKKFTRKNQVLTDEARKSVNFYRSDRMFAHHFKGIIPEEIHSEIEPYLESTGALAATAMDALSLLADHQGPELIKRNYLGENIDQIRFHPAYWDLMKIAVDSGMMRLKWHPGFRKKFNGFLHAAGFGPGYLYALSESGQYCPLCMTDGVARLIDKFCTPEDQARLIPGIATDISSDFLTGAMFLTEKAGGSDVGANLVRAEQIEGSRYRLYGEKWFCSNANAQIIFALARTNPEVTGTRGLSIFLVEPTLPDGSRNHIETVRLKDKLGVRSMASAECIFQGAEATLVGEEFQGFRIMTEMINLSRLYNSVAALSAGRRALVEAYQFLNFRIAFHKIALEHALVRDKLLELGALHTANFYLVWRAIEALDKADHGNEQEAQLIRMLTPMVKRWSAEKSVYIVRESMELMGGMGYIEDTVMPKIMRDVMVLPIWEGTGNIMALDMLRAMAKSQGMQVMMGEIQKEAGKAGDFQELYARTMADILKEAQALLALERDEQEYQAKRLFSKLTTLFQASLLLRVRDEESKAWIDPSFKYLMHLLGANEPGLQSVEEIKALIAWDF